MRQWTRKTSKLKLLLASVLFAACSADPSLSPQPRTVPPETSQPSTSTSIGPADAFPSTTVLSEPSPTTVPSTTPTTALPQAEPILCDSYPHPYHHLTCEVAGAQAEAATAPSAPPAQPQSYDSELQACIAHYESMSGLHPNIYQFQQGTWEAYGGTGSPSNASKAEQDRIFWLAWEDAGEHHWLAQKGRCF